LRYPRCCGTADQAEQVEFAFGAHLVEHFVGGEIVDAEDHALAQIAKILRQRLKNLMRHGFHLGKGGCFGGGPHPPILARVPPQRPRIFGRARG